MEALGGGNGGIWRWNFTQRNKNKKQFDSRSKRSNSKRSDSVDATGRTGYRFPFKQAVTAASLALTGDTIAQVTDRWRKRNALENSDSSRLSKVRFCFLMFVYLLYSFLFGC